MVIKNIFFVEENYYLKKKKNKAITFLGSSMIFFSVQKIECEFKCVPDETGHSIISITRVLIQPPIILANLFRSLALRNYPLMSKYSEFFDSGSKKARWIRSLQPNLL